MHVCRMLWVFVWTLQLCWFGSWLAAPDKHAVFTCRVLLVLHVCYYLHTPRYDAGDNVKFNLPMAWASHVLAWSVVDFADVSVLICAVVDVVSCSILSGTTAG